MMDMNTYEEFEELEEFEEVEEVNGYEENMHCDTFGVCGGTSCPNFFKCNF